MQENPNTPENENDIPQNDLFPDEGLSDKDLSENNTASTEDDNFLGSGLFPEDNNSNEQSPTLITESDLFPEDAPQEEEIQEVIQEEPIQAIGIDAATRDFSHSAEPVNEQSTATKTFGTLEPEKPEEKPIAEAPKAAKPARRRKKKSKAFKAAKFTAKSVLFVFRKIFTYLMNFLLTVLMIGIITGTVVVMAFVIYIKNYVDPNYTGLDNLKFDSALSTTLYYVDQNENEILLDEDTLESSENRLWADYEDIPRNLIAAYIAVEDQRFGDLQENKNIINGHQGVDMTRTASAIYNFFIPTSSSYGGGSTITQQLIKNVSGENDTTMQRKIQEIFRAFNVEEKYSKNEIMEMYLNTIYLSHNSYGVRVAAQTYFGKELEDLTLAECAAIASIGKWPIQYDPIVNPKNNLERRNLVLKLMLQQELITQEEFDEAYDTPLTLADGSEEEYTATVHSYYIDTVLDDVTADLMKEYGYDYATASRVLFSGGLEIVTCLDPVIQECAEKVYENSEYWPAQSGMQAQSAMCIMDPETGNLLAIVGGLGEKKDPRGLNRATHSERQCGSSIKPVSVYALALDTGLYTAGSCVDDVPQTFNKNTGGYWPSNAGSGYRGMVSLDYAIRRSLNTIAVATCNQLGVEKVFNHMLEHGYTTLVEYETRDDGSVFTDLGAGQLALGGLTYGITVREHTQAYSALANGGVSSKARTYTEVRDSTGKIILDNKEEHAVIYKESTAAVMTEFLRKVVATSLGTASGFINLDIAFDMEVAGKTGTTNNKYDTYFCGYTPDLLGCVWYGYDYFKTVSAGSRAPGTLWNAVFTEIYNYYDENGISYSKEFETPASVVEGVEYCTISGKLATDACRNDLYYLEGGSSCVATGTFAAGTEPTEPCDGHIAVKWDKHTRAICVDGCTCPESSIITVGLRKISLDDRKMEVNVYISDSAYVYMDVPEDYVYPTSPNVSFFYNALPDDCKYAFGTYGSYPANRVCIEHYHPEEKEEDKPDENVPAVPAG